MKLQRHSNQIILKMPVHFRSQHLDNDQVYKFTPSNHMYLNKMALEVNYNHVCCRLKRF